MSLQFANIPQNLSEVYIFFIRFSNRVRDTGFYFSIEFFKLFSYNSVK